MKKKEFDRKVIEKMQTFKKFYPFFTKQSQKTALLFSLFTLIMCGGCQFFAAKNLPDVSNIEVDLQIQRFDQDFFVMDTSQLSSESAKLLEQYPEFFPFFHETLMAWNQPATSFALNDSAVANFISNPDIRMVYDSVQKKYPNNDFIKKDLTQAFKYHKYYFPNKPIPEIITYISTFNQQGFTLGDNKLGLGLDMHLGQNFELYPSTGYPTYITKEFAPEYLACHAMKLIVSNSYSQTLKRNRLLDEMVFQGKMLYFLDLVLPEVHDSIKLGYTATQEEWCRNNEEQIWSFFIEKKLLYESEISKYDAFTMPGPTTMGMPPSSPGNIGAWVGLQIIRKWAKENPDVPFDELFDIHDGQTILKQARYKPQNQ